MFDPIKSVSALSDTSLSCETIRKERKERTTTKNAMFNRFVRRKLNPKLQVHDQDLSWAFRL